MKHIHCVKCGCDADLGAVVTGPQHEKFHVCHSCWHWLSLWLRFDPMPGGLQAARVRGFKRGSMMFEHRIAGDGCKCQGHPFNCGIGHPETCGCKVASLEADKAILRGLLRRFMWCRNENGTGWKMSAGANAGRCNQQGLSGRQEILGSLPTILKDSP